MKGLLNKIISWNARILNKAKSIKAYDEALSLHTAKAYKQAYPIMKQAAELGHPSAMTILGSMFLLGQGVPENGIEAERWLKRALDLGYSEAESVLGMAYATGKAGVEVDLALAKKFLEKASESGDADAEVMLKMMENREGIFSRKIPHSKLH